MIDCRVEDLDGRMERFSIFPVSGKHTEVKFFWVNVCGPDFNVRQEKQQGTVDRALGDFCPSSACLRVVSIDPQDKFYICKEIVNTEQRISSNAAQCMIAGAGKRDRPVALAVCSIFVWLIIGMMIYFFHELGSLPVLRDRLKIRKRVSFARAPKYLIIWPKIRSMPCNLRGSRLSIASSNSSRSHRLGKKISVSNNDNSYDESAIINISFSSAFGMDQSPLFSPRQGHGLDHDSEGEESILNYR
ncbi:hypothetical protein TNIN_220781 [Trichonephila inaurata madagascariensis]|uniref:Uncharacterized protein n=1 Tax=Trichonephila inaurata madagascariensis TaxID=2747483 RepID=A0A8X6WQ73_9ARAC|nr:hypothetical protein TNIN_220781 [Trichonephila inaurata madagascariensis]